MPLHISQREFPSLSEINSGMTSATVTTERLSGDGAGEVYSLVLTPRRCDQSAAHANSTLSLRRIPVSTSMRLVSRLVILSLVCIVQGGVAFSAGHITMLHLGSYCRSTYGERARSYGKSRHTRRAAREHVWQMPVTDANSHMLF